MNIRPIHVDDNFGAQQLVLKVLNEEFFMALTLDELPDLKDIVDTYMESGLGHYWVAVEDSKIIGSIGILKLTDEAHELRRMYVAAEYRGRGVAQKLMDILFSWANKNLSGNIYLETNEQWKAAQHIYRKYGFIPVERDSLPLSFPVVRVATGFYTKKIKGAELGDGDNAHHCHAGCFAPVAPVARMSHIKR